MKCGLIVILYMVTKYFKNEDSLLRDHGFHLIVAVEVYNMQSFQLSYIFIKIEISR